jgi:hypothetical protein
MIDGLKVPMHRGGTSMKALFVVLQLALVPVAARAQMLKVERIDIVTRGVYQSETTKTASDPNSPTGTSATVTNIRNVQATTTIKPRLGLEFGIEYVVTGSPRGATVPLKIIIRFPEQGIHNPKTGETVYRYDHVVTKFIDSRHYEGYGFDNPWEIVPSPWLFEIRYQNRKLAEQRFTVTEP